MEQNKRLDMYLELFEAAKARISDDHAAAVIVDQIGRDIRVEAMMEEREAARRARREASGEAQQAGNGSGNGPATQKQVDWLRDLGVRVPQFLTKAKASEMLDEALAKQAAR